jgi:hypothetical protein
MREAAARLAATPAPPIDLDGSDSTPSLRHADQEAERISAALSRYRLAARAIARDEGLGPRRLVALVELVEVGRQEFAGDGWLAPAVQRVIYAESFELLVHGRTPTAPRSSWQGDPVTSRLQHLRREGFERCTSCSRPVPSLDVLAAWEGADRSAWAARIRAEAAGGVPGRRREDGAAA